MDDEDENLEQFLHIAKKVNHDNEQALTHELAQKAGYIATAAPSKTSGRLRPLGPPPPKSSVQPKGWVSQTPLLHELIGADVPNEGRVLRWQSTNPTTSYNYSYIALCIENKWYLSGAGEWYGGNVLTHEQMLEVLQRPEVGAVAMATQWSAVDSLPPF